MARSVVRELLSHLREGELPGGNLLTEGVEVDACAASDEGLQLGALVGGLGAVGSGCHEGDGGDCRVVLVIHGSLAPLAVVPLNLRPAGAVCKPPQGSWALGLVFK